MKNILKIAYLLMLTFLISCDDSPSSEHQNQTAEQETKQETEKATFPDSLTYIIKDYKRIYPECEGDDCTSYTLEYIELKDKKYHFINDSIKIGLIGSYASMDDAADEFMEEYEEGAMDAGYNLPWMHDVTVGVDFNQKGLFTVSYGYYGFFGGAHGMPGFSSVNYDLATNQELELYDLVNIADSTILKSLGEKYFRVNNQIEPKANLQDDGYFWDNGKFYLSEIFTLTDDGLMFTYSPYEIGPYAIGMPEFTIPYADLKPYFTENSPLKRLIK